MSNLKPVQSTDEARARGRAGGVASGKARREKKSLRERLQALLDSRVGDMTGLDAAAHALFERVLSGDVKAFEILAAHTGQAPRQTLEPIDLPDVKTVADLPAFTAALLRAVAGGRLTVAEGNQLAALAGVHGKVLELSELERRISALEKGDAGHE
ncbi:MAG: hypothetical protein IJD16_06090 [Desulfovibrio sp.]|nr:hypothetical protein [Desulfovibrio sp.]